jgi:tRNA pseudouridine13 synthase
VIPDDWRRVALDPPRAWGEPLGVGVLRSTPEDFVVTEVLGFAAGGEGPHALLTVRKRGANTEWVGRELARLVGCKPFDVGFAGLKDRNAVAIQHFTVPRGKREAGEFLGLAGEGYEVIAASNHQRKLPRGALAGNTFELVVRGLATDAGALAARVGAIGAHGVPNYFGPQRFGRDAGNLEAVLREATEPRRSRGRDSDRGFVLSAARSVIFNAIVSARVEQGTWNRLEPGDVANLDGSGSVFAASQVDAELATRCERQDVHPTAPLMGDDAGIATGAVAAQEAAVAQQYPEAMTVVRAARMRSERRATRVRVASLRHQYAGDVLTISFALPAGSFATTVLREIIATPDAID